MITLWTMVFPTKAMDTSSRGAGDQSVPTEIHSEGPPQTISGSQRAPVESPKQTSPAKSMHASVATDQKNHSNPDEPIQATSLLDERGCLEKHPIGLCLGKTQDELGHDDPSASNTVAWSESELLFAMADRNKSSRKAIRMSWILRNNVERDIGEVILFCMTLTESQQPLEVQTYKIAGGLAHGTTKTGEIDLPTLIEIRSARCTVEEFH
jgi:hypothetical protein